MGMGEPPKEGQSRYDIECAVALPALLDRVFLRARGATMMALAAWRRYGQCS
jgi:hypothetical protein